MSKGEKTRILWENAEYREKMSKAHKGKSPSNIQKLIEFAKSPEGRKLVSERFKGKPSPKGMLGRNHTVESRIKISKGHSGKHTGKLSNFWKGGLSNNVEYQRFIKKQIEHKRRLLIKDNGLHTYGEWELLKKQYNYTCPCCHKSEPDIKLTEDHIVPITRGGSNNIENIQPLCKSCNCKKYTKTIKY